MDTSNIKHLANGAIEVNLDVGLYSRDAIVSTVYLFTDKCHINLQSYGEELAVVIFSHKTGNACEIELIIKDFLNELIDQQLRVQINNETKDIKGKIIAEAFAPLENIPELDE